MRIDKKENDRGSRRRIRFRLPLQKKNGLPHYGKIPECGSLCLYLHGS